MLDIMERTVQALGMTYHRMDGGTSVGVRARLVDDFNTNPGVFLFLLTTKVGRVTADAMPCIVDDTASHTRNAAVHGIVRDSTTHHCRWVGWAST